VVLNFAAIPTMGIVGAALVSLLTYWAYGLLLLREFRLVTAGVVWPDPA
jgi:hypothetical protein